MKGAGIASTGGGTPSSREAYASLPKTREAGALRLQPIAAR